MARDYCWARRAVGRDAVTVGDIMNALGVGRHQARHLLITSGVPARLLTRKWRGPGGRWWQRTVWSAPPEVLLILWVEYWRRRCSREARQHRLSARGRRRIDSIFHPQLAEARKRLDQRLLSDKRWTQQQTQ